MIAFLLRLGGLVQPYKLRLGLGILTGIICGFLEPAMIVTITFIFGVIFPSAGASPFDAQIQKLPAFAQHWLADLKPLSTGAPVSHQAVIWLVALVPMVMFLRGFFGYLNIYLLQWSAVRAITDLRVRLFEHLMNQSASFFSRTSTGELISRITNDTGALQNAIGPTLSVLIRDPIKLISLLALLLWQQPKLTLISLVVMPICIVPIVIYSRKVRHSSREIQTQYAEMGKLMTESFTGNRIIKAYNLESTVADQFREVSKRFVGQIMRVVRSMEIPGPLLEFFGSVGVALVLLYLAFQTGLKANAADFLTVILAIFSMYGPIKSLTRLHSQLEQARAASERVFELLATKSTIMEPANPQRLQAAKADVHFDHISFDYGEKPVLRDVTLTVKAGQVVALVGSSGSGKTTLTNLLLRFYDPMSGNVRIGETNVRDVLSKDLRAQIAVVTQETILFHDSIRKNIELGRPNATFEEVQDAARHAHAHDFITEKPEGYDTIVGEKGVALSGGQRQRLAIARAIVKNAPILVLDEATSALDAESERAVQEALEELMQGRTTICIAHRLSTIQKADLIVVLDQGRIVETGTHGELLKRGGTYQRLYELQFQS